MGLQSSERREAGPALVGPRARDGEAGVSVPCVRLRGEVVRPSEARSWHSCTRAHSSVARAVGRPARARVNFSARERAQVRGFCGARALLAFPSEVPLGCGWGGCGRVMFPSLTLLPSFCCGYWSWKKKGVAGGVAGCVGETRAPLPRAHSRALATALPQTRSLKFTPLRFAFRP